MLMWCNITRSSKYCYNEKWGD